MKKWKCTVCGYIHSGEQPPVKCPVCGADQTKFQLLEETSSSESTPKSGLPENPKAGESSPESNRSDNKWKCTVCGYIHTGSAPPEKCPVCGADRRKFVLLEEKEAGSEGALKKPPRRKETPHTTKQERFDVFKKIKFAGLSLSDLAARVQILTKLHGHPIAVHIPNGVLPLTVLFAMLSIIFQSQSLAVAAKCNSIFVCLAMPVVLASGVIDWFNRFNGQMTPVFSIKMICGGIVTLLTLVIALWWIINPEIYIGNGGAAGFFLFINIADLGAAVVAGFYGGKLVFTEE